MTGPQPPACDIHQGYRPGLIGRITEMHALYYDRAAGFGLPFEVVVSGGLSEFAGRLDRPMNAIWSAVAEGRVLGSIAIDGVSLTVVEIVEDRFSVALIPHTLSVTTLGEFQEGRRINLETDILGKYVQRLMQPGIKIA